MGRNVCVFLGSRLGARSRYRVETERFARALVAHGLSLVYGGSDAGLMNVAAETVLAAGGHVTGVFPERVFRRGRFKREVSDLRRVSTMHERKALMAELSSAFVALPGGLGTLEEIFEAVAWAQIGIHKKPCAFLNIDGYYDGLLAFLDHCVEEGFIEPRHRGLVFAEEDPVGLVERLVGGG